MSNFGDLAAVGSDNPSILADSSGSATPSDISKQLPQGTVDAWHLAFDAAKASQDAGWQPVSPNPWPAEAAFPNNAQPSAEPSTRVSQWLPPGGTYDPGTDTWERTQGAGRQQSRPAEAASPANGQRSAPSDAQSASKTDTSQEPQMPNVGVALWQGVWHGGRDLVQTGTALGGGRPDAEGQRSAAAAPLEWGDLLSPGSKLAPKLAYQIGQSWPTMAGGIAGTGLGIAAAGGPEDPLALVTGPVGGALGAGVMNGLQSFGNYFGDELHKTPGDPDGAYSRAFERAKVSGVFSGVAWAAFPARAFQGPLKNMMFQAFGVQPGINMAHQAADNALTGNPLTEGLGNAYTQGAIGTLPIAGGHYLGGEAGKVVSQYELRVDQTAFGTNGGNIRIVKKAKTTGVPEEQLSAVGRSAPVPLSPGEAANVRTWSNIRNSYLKMWREVDTSRFPAETRQLLWGKADNSIRNAMTPDDLAGVMKERRGVAILKSDGVTPYDHLKEWQEAKESAKATITKIGDRLDRLGALGQRGSQEYNILQQKRADLSKILDSYTALQVGR